MKQPRGVILERSLRILILFTKKQFVTTHELAEKFNVTYKTASRDLQILQDVFPIYEERVGKETFPDSEKSRKIYRLDKKKFKEYFKVLASSSSVYED